MALMAGQGVVHGTMTSAISWSVNAFLIQLYMPLNMLGFAYREIRNALVNMEKMFGLLDVQAEIADKPGRADLKVSGGEIVFDHVDFHYEKARPILHDVSFRVAPGNMVAIVGSSGAGKSTISRILYRFYDVAAGGVRIDGQDIRDVTRRACAAAIGVVPQDTVLFNDTIYYNIATAGPAPPARRSSRRPAWRASTTSSWPAAGLRDDGRRTRPEAVGRREAARGDRPHHPEEPAHPAVRRGRPAPSTRAPSRRSSARSRR